MMCAAMKVIVKKQHNLTTKGAPRGKGAFIAKTVKNAGTGKKKVVLCDWQHLSKQDADIIVRLLNNPPRRNEAMKTAEGIYQTIQQLD